MLKTTHPAPRSSADELLSITETHPEISLDVAEHPTDETQYLYTWFLPENLQPTLEDTLKPYLNKALLSFQSVPENVDYVALTRAQFPPLQVGPFFIARNDETAPTGSILLQIAPNRAFGSGEHATTTGCLLAYLHLVGQGAQFASGLDFGCGSAILALAAAKMHATPFLCIDNDPPSIDIAHENSTLNHTETLLQCEVGETPPQNQTYPLIFANILLQPLLELSTPLAKCLEKQPHAALILSGFTTDQSPTIEACYSQLGLKKTWQHEQAGWLAQTWQPQ